MTDLAALGANLHGVVEQRLPCPLCGKGQRDRAMGANIASGAFHCFRCGYRGRARGNDTRPSVPVPMLDPAVVERKRERLRQTWRETVPLEHQKGHAARLYLQSRALADVLHSPPKVLRAHPALDYWDRSQWLGRFPALVALFHGAAGEPVTLHVTYLRSDGCAKAAVPAPKKILGVPVKGATKGGAIRLYEARGGILGLAEGIESALSLRLIRNIPVWASFCADNLERIRLPEGLRELQIGVDIDASGKGRQVAQALAKRVKRWSPRTRVLYVTPELDGPCDLNDELRHRRTG